MIISFRHNNNNSVVKEDENIVNPTAIQENI